VSTLEDFRLQIDALDQQLFTVLGQRFEVVRGVGRFKRDQGVAMLQPAREEVVRARYRQRARDLGLSEAFGDRLAALILEEAHRLEDAIILAADVATEA